MSLPIVLRAEAELEFDQAFDWYDAQRAGLGAIFAASIQKTFDAVSSSPQMHSVVLGDVRKAVVRRFPYCVYYRAHSDRVEVLAVFHTSRDPAVWRGRL